MPLNKELIGSKLAPYEFTVERGKIREFCLAIGEKNPLYWEPETARQMGFDDTPIPPTFSTVINFWGCPALFAEMRSLGIDTKRLLHLKEEYTYRKPIYPGMRIQAQFEIKNIKTGRMEMVTFHNSYKNERGEICVEGDMTIVIPPA